MAECQESPLSFEEKEEDFGNNTSQNDGRQHWQKYSSIVHHCENGQSNQNEPNGKDRKVATDSDQAEHRSKQRNSQSNINSRESNSTQGLEEEKCDFNTSNNKVGARQESQATMKGYSGRIGGQQIPLYYAEQGSISGNGGREPFGGDRNETKFGQEKEAIEPRNLPTSYLEAAKTKIPEKSHSMGPKALELKKVANSYVDF